MAEAEVLLGLGLGLSLRTPRREKGALFSCVSVNFFGKTGRVSYFCTNLCITEIPVASWVFWHTYRPCPMIPSRRNADACILHACECDVWCVISFTIAKTWWEPRARPISAPKCSTRDGCLDDIWFVEKYETLPILPFIYWRLKCNLFRGGGS